MSTLLKLCAPFLKQTKIPHSLLFYSNKILSKEDVYPFIQSIFCLNKNPFYCNQCKSCLDFKKGHLPDFFLLESEKEIGIEEIKSLFKRIQYGPVCQSYYVVFIPNAEKMTLKAANAFLKGLEEPPSNVCFILTASHLHALLPTIKSRCNSLFIPHVSASESCTISIDNLLQLPLMKRIDAIEEIMQNKQTAIIALYGWLHTLINSETWNLKTYQRTEKIIRKIEALGYNCNVRLQLSALMLSL